MLSPSGFKTPPVSPSFGSDIQSPISLLDEQQLFPSVDPLHTISQDTYPIHPVLSLFENLTSDNSLGVVPASEITHSLSHNFTPVLSPNGSLSPNNSLGVESEISPAAQVLSPDYINQQIIVTPESTEILNPIEHSTTTEDVLACFEDTSLEASLSELVNLTTELSSDFTLDGEEPSNITLFGQTISSQSIDNVLKSLTTDTQSSSQGTFGIEDPAVLEKNPYEQTNSCETNGISTQFESTTSSHLKDLLLAPISSSKIIEVSPSQTSPNRRGRKRSSPIDSQATNDRKLKKKRQNKEAATRYREKKRKETEIGNDEFDQLERKNKQLKEKVESISREIGYLKNLLQEVNKAKILAASSGS